MLEFDTKKEAENYLRDVLNCKKGVYKNKVFYYPSGIYYLKHGEYAKPDYYVRKFRGKDKYGIYVKFYYLNNTFNIPADGFLKA